MTGLTDNTPALPNVATLARAVRIFLDSAYPQGAPETALLFIPPDDTTSEAWLTGPRIERTPSGAAIGEVRSFAARLGNAEYPHMKLRLSRVPGHDLYVLSVDSHDAILQAPTGSPDHDALEALKRHNATLASQITTAMTAADLPTETTFLRDKIRRIKQDNPEQSQ